MKLSKALILLLVTVPLLTFGQKIKYKDLFPLLNAKNYSAENENNLRAFLGAQKKPHANGTLQLAYIFEEKFYQIDILADTTAVTAAADSAVTQLKQSITLINEKELKRNEEYYQSFYRRDLRTGDFGIKISDVHLDLEKKVENIQARKNAITEFNILLVRIKGRNELSANIYQQMVEKSSTVRGLVFKMTDDDLLLLDQVIDNAAGVYVLVDDLKESARELGADYYQEYQVFKIIENYGVDGFEQSDVFSGKLDLWDYETWAKSVKTEYYGVKQYKQNIRTQESKINKAFDQVASGMDPGSIDVGEIEMEAEKYDPDGTAIDLLNFRTTQLEVSRLSNPSINVELSDTANVFAQLGVSNKVMEELGSMTAIYTDLSSPEKISIATNRYPEILDEYYGGSSGYDEFIQNLSGWINTQKITWAARTDSLLGKEKYAVAEDIKIPLFVNEERWQYMTLVVSGEATKMVAGIDTVNNEGYLVRSGPARGINSKISLKIGKMSTDSLKAQVLPTLTFGFYFFDPTLSESNLLLVASGETGEVKWSNLVTAPNEPVSFRFDVTLDQLTVFFFPEDQLPEGVTAYIVIDRNGVVR